MSDKLLQFFAYEHLPEHLRAVSAPFGQLAKSLVETLPENSERTVAMRKLLEAKDCAVRALLFKDVEGERWESPFKKPNTSARSGMGIPKQ